MRESTPPTLETDLVRHIANSCLCLHTQRAARALARLFDEALRPVGLTNQQFSLLMALNRPAPLTIGALAAFLAMDRTSLTAALKPLAGRGLLSVRASETDRRSRIVAITEEGVRRLQVAAPIWRTTHARLDAALTATAAERLRTDLRAVPGAAKARAR